MKVRIKDLCFSYKMNPVLDQISFDVHEHEIVAVLGPNGAGKSTLLKCINRILDYKKGVILIGEDDTRRLSRLELAQEIGYVAQRSEAARLTTFDAVLLGRHPYLRYRISEQDIRIVNAIIEKLHMQELSLRYVDQLSGGELQKVCIARALVQDPGLLLLDEPTGSLDLKNQVELLQLIRKIIDGHNVSAIMSLHDINLAIHYADRIIFLKDQKIHSICVKNEITREIIREVYDIEVTLYYAEDYPVVVPAVY